MEELFSHRLNYLQNHSEIYLSIPMEIVTYNLEKRFQQQLAEKLHLKTNETYYNTEYEITQEYLAKALRRSY